MSENTKIEWADHTYNPWIGCSPVGPGCDGCYARAEWQDRRHRVMWGAGQPRSRTKTQGEPVRWNKNHEAFFSQHGRRQRVFCASLADVFDNDAPTEWRVDLLRLIAETPNLDWLLLTKRIGNVNQMMTDAFQAGWPFHEIMWARWPELFRNVWIGATICTQEEADRDIPKLLNVRSTKRFLSIEPLLGPMDLTVIHRTSGEGFMRPLIGAFNRIDWVIVGGESGPRARPMRPEWARSLRDQCKVANVPFMFKQWGEWRPVEIDMDPGESDVIKHFDGQVARIGKKVAGRLLDGREWNEVTA